ncbi:MAG: hypothetical protein R3348_04725, partial [Xanthomonadales bacterium]|nr:hypothetical protein [Xanthomonadales bacterium]
TLEHIHDVLGFLRGLRAAIGNRTGIPVFFEVPDTDRVLREGAFWDIYYEHCSYFSQDNLCALFERSGFDVEECWMDYDDQYLMLLARPVTSEHGAVPAAPVSGTGRESQPLENQRSRWAQSLAGWRREGLEVVLWGGGSKAVAFLNTLESSALVSRVIDINPHKQGAYIPGTGQRVVAPEDLADRPADLVILMNPVYEPEVRASLQRLGSEAELRSLG